jgi:DNA replication protein DnaC
MSEVWADLGLAEAERALEAAERALEAIEAAPGPASRVTRARALVARWGARRDACTDRARRQAERRTSGPAFADCACDGSGGIGALVGLAVQGADGRPVLAHVDGAAQWTYERLCSCPDGRALAREAAAARRTASDQLRAARVARIAGAAEIPTAYDGLTVDTWADRAERGGTAEIVRGIRAWQDEATDGPRARLLLLAGNQGVGKSGLAASLAQAWVELERGVLYRTVPRLAARLRAAPWRARQEPDALPTELELLDALSTVDLLVLDDLGAEGAAGAGAEILHGLLFDILDMRMQSCRPTIVTTNLTPDEVTARYGARLYERLYAPSVAVVAALDGPNLRWPAP